MLFGIFGNGKNDDVDRVDVEQKNETFSLSTILNILKLQSDEQRYLILRRIKDSISMEVVVTIFESAETYMKNELERLQSIEENMEGGIEGISNVYEDSVSAILDLINILCKDEMDHESSNLKAQDIRLYAFAQGFLGTSVDLNLAYYKYRCKSEYQSALNGVMHDEIELNTLTISEIIHSLFVEDKIREDVLRSGHLLAHVAGTARLLLEASITLDICRYNKHLVKHEVETLRLNAKKYSRHQELFSDIDGSPGDDTLTEFPKYSVKYSEECNIWLRIASLISKDSLSGQDALAHAKFPACLSNLMNDLRATRGPIISNGRSKVSVHAVAQLLGPTQSYMKVRINDNLLLKSYKWLDQYIMDFGSQLNRNTDPYFMIAEHVTIAREANRLILMSMDPYIPLVLDDIRDVPFMDVHTDNEKIILAKAYRKLEKLYLEQSDRTNRQTLNEGNERYKSACHLLGIIQQSYRDGKIKVYVDEPILNEFFSLDGILK